MSVDILGTCRSMVQYSFTSTETRRLVRTDSPGRPPRLSHSSWTMRKIRLNDWLYIVSLCKQIQLRDVRTKNTLLSSTSRPWFRKRLLAERLQGSYDKIRWNRNRACCSHQLLNYQDVIANLWNVYLEQLKDLIVECILSLKLGFLTSHSQVSIRITMSAYRVNSVASV